MTTTEQIISQTRKLEAKVQSVRFMSRDFVRFMNQIADLNVQLRNEIAKGEAR